MTTIEAAIFGVIQGITEFLPISSDGHLALYEALIGSKSEQPLAFTVLVHMASLLAIVGVFRRELMRLFFGDRRLGVYICVGTIPAVIAGLLLHDPIEELTKQPMTVSVFLIATGGVLVVGEMLARRAVSSIREQEASLWQVLVIGVAQAFALLPGISRSGMTMSAGRALGLARDASVRFSFLLGAPAIAGAGCYEALKIFRSGTAVDIGLAPAAAGFGMSLVTSWIALLLLIRIVRRAGLWVFSPYCLFVGVAGLIWFGWR